MKTSLDSKVFSLHLLYINFISKLIFFLFFPSVNFLFTIIVLGLLSISLSQSLYQVFYQFPCHNHYIGSSLSISNRKFLSDSQTAIMRFSTLASLAGFASLVAANDAYTVHATATAILDVVCSDSTPSTVTQTVTITASPDYKTPLPTDYQPPYVTTVFNSYTSVDYEYGSDRSTVYVCPTGTGSRTCAAAIYNGITVIEVVNVNINVQINAGTPTTVTVTDTVTPTYTPIPPTVTVTLPPYTTTVNGVVTSIVYNGWNNPISTVYVCPTGNAASRDCTRTIFNGITIIEIINVVINVQINQGSLTTVTITPTPWTTPKLYPTNPTNSSTTATPPYTTTPAETDSTTISPIIKPTTTLSSSTWYTSSTASHNTTIISPSSSYVKPTSSSYQTTSTYSSSTPLYSSTKTSSSSSTPYSSSSSTKTYSSSVILSTGGSSTKYVAVPTASPVGPRRLRVRQFRA